MPTVAAQPPAPTIREHQHSNGNRLPALRALMLPPPRGGGRAGRSQRAVGTTGPAESLRDQRGLQGPRVPGCGGPQIREGTARRRDVPLRLGRQCGGRLPARLR